MHLGSFSEGGGKVFRPGKKGRNSLGTKGNYFRVSDGFSGVCPIEVWAFSSEKNLGEGKPIYFYHEGKYVIIREKSSNRALYLPKTVPPSIFSSV